MWEVLLATRVEKSRFYNKHLGTRRKLSILSWKNVLKFEVLQVSPAGFRQSSLHFPAKSRDPPGNYAKLSHFFKYLTRRAELFTVFRKIPKIRKAYDWTKILKFIFFSKDDHKMTQLRQNDLSNRLVFFFIL